MPIVCWGALGKSANDPTTIDQEIAGYILAHNADPNAHGLNGYALQVHRSDIPLDHVDYSVTSDKITADQIVGKDFRTAPDVGAAVDGVLMNPAGIQMYQGGQQMVNIPVSGSPTFLGIVSVQQLRYLRLYVHTYFESFDQWQGDGYAWLIGNISTLGFGEFATYNISNNRHFSWLNFPDLFAVNNPFLEMTMQFPVGGTGFGYIGLGFIDDMSYFSDAMLFAEIHGAPYAMVYKGGHAYTARILDIDATQINVWRMELHQEVGEVRFIVNGQQYAVINDPGLSEFPDQSPEIILQNTTSTGRQWRFYNLAFGYLA